MVSTIPNFVRPTKGYASLTAGLEYLHLPAYAESVTFESYEYVKRRLSRISRKTDSNEFIIHAGRIIHRIEHGRHDVPPEVQEQRYEKIIQTFPELLKISDISAVFDNSGTSSPKSSKPAHSLIFLIMHENNYFVFNDYTAWLKFSFKNCKTRKLLVPVYERINGRKTKKAEEKVWLNKKVPATKPRTQHYTDSHAARQLQDSRRALIRASGCLVRTSSINFSEVMCV